MREPGHIAVCFVLALVTAGCSEFPCEDDATTHVIPPVEFSYEDRVRYTYWFEDGAQRITFERDQIPDDGRGAVLVHVEGKTAGGLHGAAGWAADITDEGGASAHFVPMAIPRAAAYVAWVGAWRASWLKTKSSVLAEEILAADAVRDELGYDEEADDDGELDPERLLAALKPEKDEESVGVKVRDDPNVPTSLREQLGAQGISINALKLTRALRVVGAREPVPRDFGLSIDVHPIWVFVEDGCGACDEATAWLDSQGVGYHVMRVSDPTNATTLRSLTERAAVEKPAVPSLWKHGKLLRGFEASAWAKELK